MAYTFTRTGAQIEEIHNTVEDPKSNAQFSDDIRTIAGEYRGLWPDTGGSANKGDTYQTQVSGTGTGQYFTALQNTTVDPVGDDLNWREVVSVAALSYYTDVVYSSVDDMLAGFPVIAKVGDTCSTGGTIWQRVGSVSGDLADFKALTKVCVFDFGVKGDFDWSTLSGTDDTLAIQGMYDKLGIFGEQSDNPIQDRAQQYDVVFPEAFYYGTDTIYCDYHNINVEMKGTYVLDASGVTALDFDFTRSRRPGVVEVKSAAAYKRKIVVKTVKLDRDWSTSNPSPTKYDRIVFSFSANVSLGDTFTLNNRSYTFTSSPSLETDVQIGASLSDTIDNAVSTLAVDPQNYCTVSRTANQLVIEKGASYLTSSSNSASIADDKFIETDKGVMFGNVWDSEIDIREASSFCIGWEFRASASVVGGFGMETNIINQGRIDDCQVSGRFSQTDGAYHHDSLINQGNWKVSGPAGSGTSHYGFVMDNIRASNNTFFMNDHEPTTPTGSEETPTYLFMGRAFRNRTLYSRGERATLIARLENGEIDPGISVNEDLGPVWNAFVAGYENLDIEDNSKIKENYTSKTGSGRYSTNHEIASPWNVNLYGFENIYDGSTVTGGSFDLQVQGWQFALTSDTGQEVYKRTNLVSLDDANGAVSIPSNVALCVGVLSLTGDEELLLSGSSSGNAGRPFVRVFDNNGDPIISRDSVIGSNGEVGNLYRIVYDSSTNSWTTLGTDQTGQLYQRIRFNNPDIAFAIVGVRGGSNSARIRALKLYSRQDAPPLRVAQTFNLPRDIDGQISVPSAPLSSPTRKPGSLYFSEVESVVGSKIQLGWRRNDADDGFTEMWCETSS